MLGAEVRERRILVSLGGRRPAKREERNQAPSLERGLRSTWIGRAGRAAAAHCAASPPCSQGRLAFRPPDLGTLMYPEEWVTLPQRHKKRHGTELDP